jgi:serine/threonine protein kinase
VHDFFVFGKRGHIVMERVVGKPLGGNGGGRRRPEKTAVAITMNILRALRHVHGAGYLHMDIKPPNVLVPAGSATAIKLLDFGGASPKNFRGRYKGTPEAGYPPYMPPEQFEAPAILDDSADLYQAAGVCVFLLTGKMPIDAPKIGDDKEYDAACCQLQKRGLTREIANTRLKRVLAKALDPVPSNRYQNAQDLIDALRPFGG